MALTSKFIIPIQFFRLAHQSLTASANLDNLFIAPNFNNIFFFDKKLIGLALSSYKSLIKSPFGYYSVLHVKGIGFKVFYFAGLHSLYFSLGYNHIVKYKLPKSLTVKVRKQYLLFFSYDKCVLGTSIYQIQRLRFPDPYRGKGIRFRFQLMVFKPGKQR